MAYDLNAYIPPSRGYVVERAQSPAYRGRRADQSGFDSLPTAHDDYLEQEHGTQSRPIADKQAQAHAHRGRTARDESRRREPSRPGETRLGHDTLTTPADGPKQHANVYLINHRLERVQWLRTTPFPSFPPSALSLLLPLLSSTNPGHRVMHPGRAIVLPTRLPTQVQNRPTPNPIAYNPRVLRIQDRRPPMHRALRHTLALKALRTLYHSSATTIQSIPFHTPRRNPITLRRPTHKIQRLLVEMPVHRPETSAMPSVLLRSSLQHSSLPSLPSARPIRPLLVLQRATRPVAVNAPSSLL
jgi:hypothetical protein